MPPRRYAPSYAAKKVKKLVKRNLKRKALDALNPGKRFSAKLQSMRSRMNLSKRRKVKSVDLGPRIRTRVSDTKSHMATTGFYVKGNSTVVGKKKSISPVVKMMYPSHRFMYVDNGITELTNSGIQSVTNLTLLDTDYLDDFFSKIRDLLNENSTTTAGNPLVTGTDINGEATPGTTLISGNMNKMYFETGFARLRLANNTDIGCKVEVLPILARQSVSANVPGTTNVSQTITPFTFWQQLILNQNLASNLASPIQPVGFAIDVNVPGLRPYSKQFKKDFEKFYKCLKPMKFMMSAGQNTECTILNNVYRELRPYEIMDYENVEGVTMYLMIFVEGVVVGNKTAGAVNATTSSSSVMYTLEQTNTGRVTQFNRGYTIQMSRLNRGLSRFDQVFSDPISGAIDNDGIDVAEV